MINSLTVKDFFSRRLGIGTPETFCGVGSYLENATDALLFITEIIMEKRIKSILDIGCGDLNWLRVMDLESFGINSYVGIDSDQEMLDIAKRIKTSSTFKFKCLDVRDLTCIEPFDLVLCRDLLIHLKNDEIQKLLSVLLNSGSKWFITNNYKILKNAELKRSTEYTKRKRQSRPVNLCISPFVLPQPDKIIREEKCGTDRYLYLWNLK